MDKDQTGKEGEELLPGKDPARRQAPDQEVNPMPDRELEYEENSNEKYRDRTPDVDHND